MRALRELGWLIAATLGRWLAWWPILAFWFLLGWAAQTLGMYGSVMLGSRHKIFATLVFVAGAVGYVVALVMMINSLKRSLHTPRLAATLGLHDGQEVAPQEVFRHQRALDVAINTIGPFLGMYAVWGLIERWVTDLLLVNAATNPQGRYRPSDWSVDLRSVNLPFYVVLAVATLLLRLLFGWLARRSHRRAFGAPMVLLEGMWAFSTFMVILMGLRRLFWWAQGRAFLRNLYRLDDWARGLIPDWHLPFGLHLPTLVVDGWDWLWGSLVPAMWNGALLPLVWLALTATVFGWREFGDAAALARGTRLDRVVDALNARSTTPLARLGSWATSDLRQKYLPILQAFRLVARTGLPFIAAYLVCWNLLAVADYWVDAGLGLLWGGGDQAYLIRWIPTREILHGLLVVTLQVALYVTAFDRSLADATGVRRSIAGPRSSLDVEHPAPLVGATPSAPWTAPADSPVTG